MFLLFFCQNTVSIAQSMASIIKGIILPTDALSFTLYLNIKRAAHSAVRLDANIGLGERMGLQRNSLDNKEVIPVKLIPAES